MIGIPSSKAVMTIGPAFPVAIFYAQIRDETVATGEYSSLISSFGPDDYSWQPRETETETVLVHLNDVASDKVVLDEIQRHGLRPATMVEGLAFSSQYPNLRYGMPIIILGSVMADPMGIRHVGCITGNASSRYIAMSWFNNRWPTGYRFLAVRT